MRLQREDDVLVVVVAAALLAAVVMDGDVAAVVAAEKGLWDVAAVVEAVADAAAVAVFDMFIIACVEACAEYAFALTEDGSGLS